MILYCHLPLCILPNTLYALFLETMSDLLVLSHRTYYLVDAQSIFGNKQVNELMNFKLKVVFLILMAEILG